MKFSKVLAFAGLACAAVPKVAVVEREVVVIEERQTSVVDTVLAIVDSLEDATKANLDAISRCSPILPSTRHPTQLTNTLPSCCR